LLLVPIRAAVAADLIGQASIIDGDTLEIHGERIRLWGIDAPESTQLCRGDDSLPYRCGAKAANDLATFIAQQSVRCIPISLDQYGRTVATCSVGGADLAEWLVRSGLALDWPQYSKRKYDPTQRDAERDGRGMWTGSYVEPWIPRLHPSERAPDGLFGRCERASLRSDLVGCCVVPSIIPSARTFCEAPRRPRRRVPEWPLHVWAR
jgi:endonuclease YncB( thermonuclease family)